MARSMSSLGSLPGAALAGAGKEGEGEEKKEEEEEEEEEEESKDGESKKEEEGQAEEKKGRKEDDGDDGDDGDDQEINAAIVRGCAACTLGLVSEEQVKDFFFMLGLLLLFAFLIGFAVLVHTILPIPSAYPDPDVELLLLQARGVAVMLPLTVFTVATRLVLGLRCVVVVRPVVLRCGVLRCGVLRRGVLCCGVFCSALCFVVVHSALLCSALLCSVLL